MNRKGKVGYIRKEKIRRALITAISFALPLGLYMIATGYFGSNKNIFTIVAVLGILPAAKFMVGWIVMLPQKSAPAGIVSVTEEKAGDLVHGYELVVTAYEGKMQLDAVVICGNECACYTSIGDPKQFDFFEKHISGILNANEYYNVNVKIFNEERNYTDRITKLAENPQMYRDSVTHAKEGQEPREREELILYVIKRISL